MSRYRSPEKPGSPYISYAGFNRLNTELDGLWRVRRPEVVKALSAAAAEGDRSENAEYIYRKKELGSIDRRVRFLRKRLDILKPIDLSLTPDDPERVFFGAWVCLEDENGETRRYRVVGPDEFDADPAYISMDSPLAQAILGKRLDDEVSVSLPSGIQTLFITAIEYESE